MYDESQNKDNDALSGDEIKSSSNGELNQSGLQGQPIPQGRPAPQSQAGAPRPMQGRPVPEGQSGTPRPMQGQPMLQGRPVPQGQSGAPRPMQGQPMPQGRPVPQGQSGMPRPMQGQPIPQGRPAPQGQSGMPRPVQGRPISQGQAGTPRSMQGQPIPQGRPVSQGQSGTPRPVQGQPIPQGRPVPQGQSGTPRPMQGRPVPQGQSGTPRPVQGQPIPQGRPVPQGQSGTPRPMQGQPIPQGRPVPQGQSGTPRPMQGQPMPQGRPVPQGQSGAPRPVQGQPMPQGRPVPQGQAGMPRPMQGQPIPQGRPAPQGQAGTPRPMQGQPIPQGRPAPQGQAGAPRPVQGQPIPQGQPGASQPMQGMIADFPPVPGQSDISQTVQGTAVQGDLQMPAAGWPMTGEPQVSVGDQAVQRLRAMRQAQQAAGVPQEAVNYASQPMPVSQPEAAVPVAEAPIRPVPEEKNHTYEITIKFDVDAIRRKFSSLKEKLKPETRTLEDVNAAMEENRQWKAERDLQEKKTIAETGAAVTGKAKNLVKSLPKKLRKEVSNDDDILDTGESVDAEIKQLEGESARLGKVAGKLEDIRDAMSGKASAASRVVFNVLIFVFCIGIAYFFASFVTTYVAHQTTVEGESMEPTLTDGDTVIIQRLTYYFKSPARYDVVVFPVSYDEATDEDTYYIKRVIGLPGETVQIIEGSVYINGEKLQDDKYALSDILEAGVAADPLVLGENQYFVMGDNRNMSTDSRNSYVGLVNKKDIIGEAWICMWPLRHFGSLKR